MKIIGKKDTFAIEFEITDPDYGLMEIWVNGIALCSYLWENKKFVFWGNLKVLQEWFSENIDAIIKEDSFPLDVGATSCFDFEFKCAHLPFEDFDEFEKWYEPFYDWTVKHCWVHNNQGGALPNVYFRRVENKIQIEWNEILGFELDFSEPETLSVKWSERDLYDGPVFDNPKGIEFVDVQTFSEVIHKFIKDF